MTDLGDILAEGGWTELIGIIVVVGFYILSAIVKSLGDRSSKDPGDAEQKKTAIQSRSASQLGIQTSQQRAARNLPYAKSIEQKKTMSEWDRKQALIRQRMEQLRKQQQIQQQQPVIKSNSGQGEASYIQRPTEVVPVPAPLRFQPSQFESSQPAYTYKPPVQTPPIRRPQKPAIERKTAPSAVKTKKIVPSKPKTVKSQVIPKRQFFRMILSQPQQVRNAMILKEILDKPISLREDLR